jgi:hypothetical protein
MPEKTLLSPLSEDLTNNNTPLQNNIGHNLDLVAAD